MLSDAGLTIPLNKLSAACRLFSKTVVRSEDECWPFQGAIGSDGYGHIRLDGKVTSAHRMSFSIFHGDPTGIHVMHSCDNTICVNPKHLSAGDHLANMADCSEKRRTRSPRPGNGFRKLSETDVEEAVELVRNGASKSEVARRFKVTPTAIRHYTKKAGL